jgi:prepilin-type processing-associated H-X9-DG protein
MTFNNKSKRLGQTGLVELLAVLGITGIILGILLPTIFVVRGAFDKLACQNHLKQVGLAMHTYEASHRHFPQTNGYLNGKNGALLGWQVFILPQLGFDDAYIRANRASELDSNPFHNPPHTVSALVVKPYVCPADSRLFSPLTEGNGHLLSFSSFVGIVSVNDKNGFFSFGGTKSAQVLDGLSQTLMIAERPPPASLQAGPWYSGYIGFGKVLSGPNSYIPLGGGRLTRDDTCIPDGTLFGPGRLDNPCDRSHLWSLHSGGANFVFADGCVRFLPYSAAKNISALATRENQDIPSD